MPNTTAYECNVGGVPVPTLGQKVAKRRVELALSQEDLVRLLQDDWPTCSKSEISKIENDDRIQLIEAANRLRALANALKMNLDELIPKD
jgi:transcriptional regulator with XRE-family HTH domain